MLIKSQSEVRLHTGRSVHFTPADVPDPPFRFFEGLVPRLQAHHPLICLFVSEGLVFCSPDMSMTVNWGMHDLGYWMLTSIFWAMVLHYTPPDLG